MTKDSALRMALEALKNAYWPTESDLMPAHNIKECGEAITAIKEALAQQSNISELKEKTANHNVDCLCADCSMLDDLEDATAQPEQEKERCVGCEACIDTACGRDECPNGWPKAAQPEKDIPKIGCVNHDCDKCKAQPEQEPVAWMREDEMKAMTSLEKDAWVKSGKIDLVKDYNKPLGYLSEGGAERLITKKQTNVPIRNFKLFTHDVPVYTTPPQRPWVGLTPEEVKEISLANRPYVVDMVVALEARLKEKNHGT